MNAARHWMSTDFGKRVQQMQAVEEGCKKALRWLEYASGLNLSGCYAKEVGSLHSAVINALNVLREALSSPALPEMTQKEDRP